MENNEAKSPLEEVNDLTLQGRDALFSGDGQLAYRVLARKHKLILKIFGPNAGPTGTSLIDLAEALHLIGRTKEARTAINEALAIYERLDRSDSMRDRLEHTLIDICRRQGHAFEIERISRARLEKAKEGGADRSVQSAIDQDELAMLYIRQGRYDEALELLYDSLSIFEQERGPEAVDTGICCFSSRGHYVRVIGTKRRKYMDAGDFDARESVKEKTLTVQRWRQTNWQ